MPLIAMIFVMGLAPRPFLRATEPAVNRFLNTYKQRLAEPDGPARTADAAVQPGALRTATRVAPGDAVRPAVLGGPR
jgi:hypothetical protein